MYVSRPIEGLIPGLRGRVLTALVRSPQPLGVREIARRAGTSSPSSVTLVLRDLVADGLARISLAAKSGHFFALNEQHLLVQHLVEIDRARDIVMGSIRDRAALWARPPEAVVLFGSVARQQDDDSSDIDVMIVWAGDEPPCDAWSAEKARVAEEIHGLTGNVLNIVDFSGTAWAEAVAAAEPLVAEIERDGVSLLGPPIHLLVRGAAARTSP